MCWFDKLKLFNFTKVRKKEKNCKKVLTKKEKCSIINKLSERGSEIPLTVGTSLEKTSKKFQKGLDKPKGKWYNIKVAAKSGGE